jgi:hypothetical protein
MTKARLDGLQMLILGSVFFVAIGAMMERVNPLGMTDFQEIYYASRCAAGHHDPYQPEQVAAVYYADKGNAADNSPASATKLLIVFVCTNLPSTLFLVSPLAALPWKLAVLLWMLLIAAAFIFACFLMWDIGVESSPRLSGGLICLLLVNSGVLLMAGNPAGLVVSFSVIAVCCFIQNRFVAAGVVGLAIALAMKPHDAGLVWLYFVLAGGAQRKRALQSLALTAAIAVVAVLWLSHVTPHWMQGFQANWHSAMSAGGRDNPGPTTQGGRGFGQIISLQAILSLIRDDPHFYNPVAYVICGLPLLLWCLRALRAGNSQRMSWFALAAVSALTLLPVYHRNYDARILLLTVPACTMLWSQRDNPRRTVIAHCALGLTITAIVLTGDIFWIAFFQITHYSGPAGLFAMFPAPIILLVTGIFYLWLYLREEPTLHSERA